MSRLKAQRGFTVVEMLVAMSVLGVVAIGALTFVEIVMRQGRGVLERTDSAQHGRLALDAMTRQIRSQVCLDATTEGLVAATPTSLTFYADLTDGSGAQRPLKRTLEYQPGARRIMERVYVSSAGGAYPSAPTRETVLLQDVVAAVDESKSPAPALPFFSYFAYPDPLPVAPQPDEPLTGTLSPAAVGRVALVRIAFGVRPTGGRNDDFVTPLQDDVVLRNADPNATKPDPTCR